MNHAGFSATVKRLNEKARQHPVGMLQRIRKELKGLSRCSCKDLFSFRTTKDDYAYHYGGRCELQFNIWVGDGEFRHGVAFSCKRDQTLQEPVKILGPKIEKFNKFMRCHPNFYRDMRLWISDKDEPEESQIIPRKLLSKDAFIFLGKYYPTVDIDHKTILEDFDRLLPLYEFVELSGKSKSVPLRPTPYVFCPGFSKRASSATATQVRKRRDVDLIQNKLQPALCRRLVSQFGDKNVGDEQLVAAGAKVDVVVQRSKALWFYEIKTENSARACLRKAIGQLLEYAFWNPLPKKVTRLIVVGRSAIDKEGRDYLKLLKKRFNLPIEYEHVTA